MGRKGAVMPQRFCHHLEEYGVQFVRAEAAYEAFNAMVDRAVSEEDTSELKRALDTALDDWQRETRALRTAFQELHTQGKIVLPRNALSGHRPNSELPGLAKCAQCRHPVPRLQFSEWQIAHNGAVNFRGEELDLKNSDLALVD